MPHPKFIVFDGLDGAGKSTGISAVADVLRAAGHEVVFTREPGGTSLGEKLREIVLLDKSLTLSPEVEAMLMAAGRRAHVEDVIQPALSRGAYVLCDRFSDSTRAYQGAKGVSDDFLSSLENLSHPGLSPGLTILFDIPVHVSRQRLAKTGKEPDRFESRDDDFFAAVRKVYLGMAARTPEAYKVVDATMSVESVRDSCVEAVLQSMKPRRSSRP